MHYLDEDLIEKEEIEHEVDIDLILDYIHCLRRNGINFPKQDPLNYNWTDEKLKKYIREHTPENIILPWEYPYPPR